MGKVKGKNTMPELKVRSMLHKMGFRFTVNGPLNKSLPGKPDIVLPKHRTVVFVHGCFWHRHPGCKAARIPKSSRTGIDWKEKLEGNARRDRRNERRLRKMGWSVLKIWECRIKKDETMVAAKLTRFLNHS